MWNNFIILFILIYQLPLKYFYSSLVHPSICPLSYIFNKYPSSITYMLYHEGRYRTGVKESSFLLRPWNLFIKKMCSGTSLVAQWIRILLSMQESPWSRRFHIVEQLSLCTPATVYLTEACVLQLLKSKHLEPVLHDRRSHHNEKPVHHNFN